MKNGLMIMILFYIFFIMGCESSPALRSIIVDENTPQTEKCQIMIHNDNISYFDDIKIDAKSRFWLIDIPSGQHKVTLQYSKFSFSENFIAGKCYLISYGSSITAGQIYFDSNGRIQRNQTETRTYSIKEIGNARWNIPITNDLTMDPGESIVIFHGNFPNSREQFGILFFIDDILIGPVGPFGSFPQEIMKIKIPNGNRKISVIYAYGFNSQTQAASIDIDANSNITELVIKNSFSGALSIVKK